MMPNMMPRVGRGKLTNVFYNTGHGHLGWTLSAVTADMVGGVVHDAMKPSVPVTAGKPLPAFQALDSALLALPAQINQWLTHERQRCGSQCEIMLDSVKKLIGTSNSLLA